MDKQFELNKAMALTALESAELKLNECIKECSEHKENYFNKDFASKKQILDEFKKSFLETRLVFEFYKGILMICFTVDFYSPLDALMKFMEYNNIISELAKGIDNERN